MKKQHSKVLIILCAIVLGMFAFCFALVPIYNSLCKTLGINGKIDITVVAKQSNQIQSDRVVEVQFVATNSNGVLWDFHPTIQKIMLHPGEMARLAFYAENKTGHTMTVQAIPSVTPGEAAKFIKKTECFCFTQQTLNGHEAMDMPLLFHLDANLPAKVKTITLAYTLFDVTNRVTAKK
jgi:cytochrome c oxidase assembly protein subunit 11